MSPPAEILLPSMQNELARRKKVITNLVRLTYSDVIKKVNYQYASRYAALGEGDFLTGDLGNFAFFSTYLRQPSLCSGQ